MSVVREHNLISEKDVAHNDVKQQKLLDRDSFHTEFDTNAYLQVS